MIVIKELVNYSKTTFLLYKSYILRKLGGNLKVQELGYLFEAQRKI